MESSLLQATQSSEISPPFRLTSKPRGSQESLPLTLTYGQKDHPLVCQSQPAASSSSSAANRPPRRISASGGPTSTI